MRQKNFSTPLNLLIENYDSVSLIEGKWLERRLNDGEGLK